MSETPRPSLWTEIRALFWAQLSKWAIEIALFAQRREHRLIPPPPKPPGDRYRRKTVDL